MIPMNDIKYLIGNQNTSHRSLRIFADESCAFLDDLSRTILASQESKAYPDLISFAFWIRKANIQKLKASYQSNTNRLGRGLCFHIAPSNIPINFAFSFVFSLLAGNSNIVRLPSKIFPQVEIFLGFLDTTIKKYPTICNGSALITYSRESDATQYFSKLADARMIWGGDGTIKQIRKLATKPRAIDITFADRYSLAVINADGISKLDTNSLKKLAADFYNDTYLMDQNACSSPQLICWMNSNAEAKNKFWESIFEISSQKYILQDSIVVDKYTKLCQDSLALEHLQYIERTENILYRVGLDQLNENVQTYRGKSGYFYEYDLKSLDELMAIVTDKYQTITYFGIRPELIQNFILENTVSGIDRIVPIGKAMDIDVVWDGHDLILELSREIVAK